MDDVNWDREREIVGVCEFVGVLVVDFCGTEGTNDMVDDT
jgi:hypothetical protein